MKRVFVALLFCLALLNCAKKEEKIVEKNIPYIISQENREKITGKDTIPPMPPIPGWLVYGTDTFILDSDTTIYYFQRNEIGMICGTPTADTIPYFINLQPRGLILLSNKNIYDFIKLNYNNNFRNITFIASSSDTINSKAFFDLRKSLNSFKKFRDRLFVRRTTQEEDTVLKYKRNNDYYHSEDIKWDKNRIAFPFIKPKVNFSN